MMSHHRRRLSDDGLNPIGAACTADGKVYFHSPPPIVMAHTTIDTVQLSPRYLNRRSRLSIFHQARRIRALSAKPVTRAMITKPAETRRSRSPTLTIQLVEDGNWPLSEGPRACTTGNKRDSGMSADGDRDSPTLPASYRGCSSPSRGSSPASPHSKGLSPAPSAKSLEGSNVDHSGDLFRWRIERYHADSNTQRYARRES